VCAVRLHPIHGSLGPQVPASKTASRSVHPFLQGSRWWPTNRQTRGQTDRHTHAHRNRQTGGRQITLRQDICSHKPHIAVDITVMLPNRNKCEVRSRWCHDLNKYRMGAGADRQSLDTQPASESCIQKCTPGAGDSAVRQANGYIPSHRASLAFDR